MKRRDFIKDSSLAAAGMTLGSRTSFASSDRPNVLFILVDQMRTPRWTPLLETPNIDRIAREGVSFDNHFVSASPCSPSRACLLTGTYTTQNEMYLNCDFTNGDAQPSLDPSIPTIGHVFAAAGYSTPYRGKWHLTHRKDRNRLDPLLDYGFTGFKPPDALFGGPPYNGALQDPFYASQTVRWLRNPDNHTRPWFLVCSLVNPHDICSFPRYYPQWKLKSIKTESTPPNWNDDLENKPGCQREYSNLYNKLAGNMPDSDPDIWRRYLDYYVHCCEDVDDNIGRVLDALEKSGRRDRTIVVFTSDHGDMGGSHRLRAKGCFAYDEEMRTPLIISAPQLLPSGIRTGSFASNIDIMPTLMNLAGINTSPVYLPGVDLRPVLHDPENTSVREEIIFHQDSELKTGLGEKQDKNFKHPAHIRCLRDREWKYSFYFSPKNDLVEHELYNLKEDPLEMHNLALDPGYIKRRVEMYERLMERESALARDYTQSR